MASPRIVAIGASAGGVEAVLAVTRGLPRNFPAPVCVVVHVPPQSPSLLAALINRGKGLIGASPKDGEVAQPGRAYVAPPDSHLLVRHGRIRLSKGPAENGSRPALDPLFRSAADGYGAGAIGVVLSGSLDDGTAGLYAIKEAGGIAIVQDPEEALYPSMPRSALEHVAVDHVVRCAELPALLVRLVSEPVQASAPGPREEREEIAMETELAEHGPDDDSPVSAELGFPSGFACPDCHGVLWEIKDGELTRFRCRVGHAYLPESLAAAQSARLEEALWTALRSLRESSALAARLAERARAHGMPIVAETYERRAKDARERAGVIETVLKKGKLVVEGHQT